MIIRGLLSLVVSQLSSLSIWILVCVKLGSNECYDLNQLENNTVQ